MNWVLDDESQMAIPFQVKSIERNRVWGEKIYSENDKELCAVDIEDIYDSEIEAYDAYIY